MDAADDAAGAIRALDAKVSALLAITIDRHLRDFPDVAKLKARTIDKLLVDAGLKPADVAKLLGKTERAVYLQLEAK